MAGRGYLVCGDITGYTAYLSHSELEHATGILGDLLRVLLGRVRDPLRLSRVEGDAVIAFAPPGGDVAGAEVVARIDDAYVAFRRALELMVLNTTCACNACANIAALDLKFVVHHGEFAVQRLGAQDELVGPEVNFMFRLTKNRIRERLGLPGYVAVTDQAIAEAGPGALGGDVIRHEEDDPERGAVVLHVRDMAAVWAARRVDPVFPFPEDRVIARLTRDFDAPVPVVWDILTRPETRREVFEADGMEVEGLLNGSIGLDSVYVCAHGDKLVRQTVVDWQPQQRYVIRNPLLGGVVLAIRYELAPVPGGTRVTSDAAIERGGLRSAVMARLAGRSMRRYGERGLDRVGELVRTGTPPCRLRCGDGARLNRRTG